MFVDIINFRPQFYGRNQNLMRCIHLICRILVSFLINPQVHGWSVLHIAAEKGFAEIYELLLLDPTVDTTLKDKVNTIHKVQHDDLS